MVGCARSAELLEANAFVWVGMCRFELANEIATGCERGLGLYGLEDLRIEVSVK